MVVSTLHHSGVTTNIYINQHMTSPASIITSLPANAVPQKLDEAGRYSMAPYMTMPCIDFSLHS